MAEKKTSDTTNNSHYSASDLKVLKGLEPVRVRPGMYIGSTDTVGLHHLIWEIVDNSVDEANEGYGKKISVTIHEDNSITVEDEGRGVPCEYNAAEKMTGFDIVYNTLHGGGKFDESNYKSAGGLHGVGGAVVNALSDYMEIHSYRDGKDNFIRYENGGRKNSGIKDKGATDKRGTKVTFKPSRSIFDNVIFDYDKIKEHLNDSACLTKGVTFELVDERSQRSEKFLYKGGIKEYFVNKIGLKETLCEPIYINKTSPEGIMVEIIYTFIKDYYSEDIISFANGVKTVDGGHHVSGFKKALTNSYNDYAIKHKRIKDTQKLEGDDIREGISAIISVRVPESIIQFEGQTKSKLGTKQALPAVDTIVEDFLNYYLEEHSSETEVVVRKSIDAMNLKKKSKEFKDSERSKVKNSSPIQLSGKLCQCSSKNYKNNELFIVEGDSAGGTAKKSRDPIYQAILPLRGKPKNVAETTNSDDIFENKELATMIYTIGAGSDKDFNIKNIHYDKIIIMTDADDDGAHIQNLLLAFFYQHLRPLVETGHVYIAVSPLYRVYKGDKEIFCWTEEERINACKKIPGYKITRYKGLGEMSPKQLKVTTMDRATRKLIKITCNDEDECSDKIKLFLGRDSDRRKIWITNNIDFSLKEIKYKEVDSDGIQE